VDDKNRKKLEVPSFNVLRLQYGKFNTLHAQVKRFSGNDLEFCQR
jgi:hypothetical protein